MMMWSSLLTAAALLHSPAAAVGQLPSVAVAAETSAVSDAEWWAHVGDRIFYTPPPEAGLSQHVGDYYYAMGSHASLTEEMQARRVGGSGRWHIFHLPEGPSALKGVRHSGSRRSSLSSLIQLQAGTHLDAQFPDYKVSRSYNHPLTKDGQNLERELVGIITPELLMKFLGEISSNTDGRGRITRSYNNPDAQKNAQKYLQDTFLSFGLSSCVQRFKSHGNVVAIIPGTGDGSLTIGAHYDSRPFDRPAPGAEDNGSGVAGLLVLAKMLAKAFADGKNKPEKTINLVAFAAEEPGLVGSDYFAEQLARGMQPKMRDGKPECGSKTSFLQVLGKEASQGRPAEKMKAHSAIVLDEVGWKTPKFSKETVNLESYDRPGTFELMDHLKQASMDHNGNSLRVEHSSHPFGSDHMSFLERSIPGVLCINGDDEAYPNYHESTDTIDNVDGDYMCRIIKMIGGAALRVAGGSHAVAHPCDADISVDIRCIQGLHDNLSAMRGGASPLLTWDLKAGDTLVFNGQVYHYTLHTAERAALAMRFVPGDYRWKGPITEMQIGAWRQWFPTECEPLSGPLLPQVYPRSNSTVNAEKWPLPPSQWGRRMGRIRAWFTERWDFFAECA